MAEKPILFSADMVRAILDGRKTVTRRVVKPRYGGSIEVYKDLAGVPGLCERCGTLNRGLRPPYQISDTIWVRETWAQVNESVGMGLKTKKTIYRANYSDIEAEGWKWRPSIHMPREAARIWLRVTDVRVERLQTEFSKQESAIFELLAEGIDIGEPCRECISAYGRPCCNDEDTDDGSECGMLDDVRDDFARLWDGTIKPADRELYGWSANPWVWVIAFERTERPVTPT